MKGKTQVTQYTLTAPAQLSGQISLPASKSIANRALIICKLVGMEPLSDVHPDSDDIYAMLNALQSGGSQVDVGASGTCMRFLTAYYSTQPGTHILDGTARMRQRPVGPLVDALRQLGADIHYLGEEGFPPLRIEGRPLDGGMLKMSGAVSSQFISALLLIAPMMAGGLLLHLEGEVVSRPYIDLTMEVMRNFGADAEWQGGGAAIRVRPTGYQPREYQVESDWTAASYWFESVALAGAGKADIRCTGLFPNSIQGDAALQRIYNQFGVQSEFIFSAGSAPLLQIRATSAPHLTVSLDLNAHPDLAQTLACTCMGLGIPFLFTGLQTLHLKETDRVMALVSEARKLGFVLESPAHGQLQWKGQHCEPTYQPIETYDDHRMAMAFAPLAIRFPHLRLNNPEVVNKSYPTFWEHFREIGCTIETNS